MSWEVKTLRLYGQDTFGMMSLAHVLGSSFLYIKSGDTLTLGWKC